MPIERPLSPHLTWYRPQLTSLLSIMHRASGVALSAGSILLVWWLIAIASGGATFLATQALIASPVGIAALAGWSVAFFYHLSNGIRHLAWDAGYGFELKTAYRSGYAVLALTGILSAIAWLVAMGE
ncbi:succinate dehydrogenase, cytochrome b556 subunit [Sphingosinicellaceae bacterium]|nr:succinate dehydrogenase, cytochrome b556 subunit [Sphingosinicellaceae bacterium]